MPCLPGREARRGETQRGLSDNSGAEQPTVGQDDGVGRALPYDPLCGGVPLASAPRIEQPLAIAGPECLRMAFIRSNVERMRPFRVGGGSDGAGGGFF